MGGGMGRRSRSSPRWATVFGEPGRPWTEPARVAAARRVAEPHLAGRDGPRKPSVNTLYALANELGVSLDDLLFMDTSRPCGRGAESSAEPPADVLPRVPVQRAATARASIRLGSGSSWERLTTESLRTSTSST